MRAINLLAVVTALAVSAFCACPALATGAAIIAGTGTGGSMADPAFNAGTSLAMVVTATVPAGSDVYALMFNASGGGTSTGFTCTDSAGNSYSPDQSVSAVTGAAAQILRSHTTSSLASGVGTVTCTQASGPSGIVGQLLAFSGMASNSYDSASPAANACFACASPVTVGPSGTLACPGGGANCEVVVGMGTFFTAGTLTNASGWTSTAPLNGSRSFISGFKLLSATTAQSYQVSDSVSSNWAGQMEAFKAASAATPKGLFFQSVP